MGLKDGLTALASKLLGFLWAPIMLICSIWVKGLLRINRWMSHWDQQKPATDFRHKVVLIGDGMAAGYGSFVRMGFECGVVQRLNIMYWRKETIKSKWFFFDRGEIESTSRDWLPDGQLFKGVFEGKAGVDTSIVVIIVGVQDLLKGLEDPKAIVEKQAKAKLVDNLAAIAKELISKGKKVCLCELPAVVEPATCPQALAIKAINRQLADLAKRLEVPLVKCSSPRVSKKDYRAWDGINLHGQGFKALGDMILEEIMQDMTKIEWAVYQDYLAGRRVAPKRKPAWWESLPGAQPEKPRAKVE